VRRRVALLHSQLRFFLID